MEALTVAIVSPGSMGAALGRRLTSNGVDVVTPAGRSASSVERARDAGLRAVSPSALGKADFVFSVVPPSQAVSVARDLAPLIGSGTRRPVYVDWNAVHPAKALEIARIVTETGGRAADGSIIGLPPSSEGPGPLLYASGPEARALDALAEKGLRFRILEGNVGAASALKMAYAGITKGAIALGSAMLLAAERAGCSDALLDELTASQAIVLAGYKRSIPDMFSKAARWAPELMEIAAFVGFDRPEAGIYSAAAAFYESLSKDEHNETQVLARMLLERSLRTMNR